MSDLDSELELIVETSAELSLPIIPGTLDDGKLVIFHWETTAPASLQGYLKTAQTVGAQMVVLQTYIFDEGTLEDLGPDELDEGDGYEADADEHDPSDKEQEFRSRWQEIVKEHSTYFDSLYAFSLSFLREGICHRWKQEASWYSKLTETATNLKDERDAAAVDIDDEEVVEFTAKEIENFATELANFGLFQQATNQNARRFALKKKFPELFEQNCTQVSDIMDQAKGVFDLEVKPAIEKALDSEIASLASQGLTKEQIAKKLKIAVSRVKKII